MDRKEAVIIDREKCIGCGECVRDCVTGHIELEDGKAFVNAGRCIRCGHCFAVCPVAAVELSEYDCSACMDYFDPAQLDADKLLLAMKSRRSIRRFTDEPVSEEDVQRIIEAGRYCPTGSNSQNVHYIILDKVKAEAEKMAIEVLLQQPFFARFYKAVPEDFLFKGAPLVILAAEKRQDNAALASSYMELMANALGLGVLYSGYFTGAANNSPQLRELIGTPAGMEIVCCLVIGHPDVKYHRNVPREEAKLTVK